jgi:hypothetical protein
MLARKDIQVGNHEKTLSLQTRNQLEEKLEVKSTGNIDDWHRFENWFRVGYAGLWVRVGPMPVSRVGGFLWEFGLRNRVGHCCSRFQVFTTHTNTALFEYDSC